MLLSKCYTIVGLMLLTGVCAVGCGSVNGNDVGVVQSAVKGPKCDNAQAKDALVSQLVIDSWRASYPLTQLYVAGDGSITGTNLPDMITGDLDIINSVADAKASVVSALDKVSGLPAYGFGSVAYDGAACTGVPAWTPTGTATINTDSYAVLTNGVNDHSWKTAHKEFGKECPLIKVNGDKYDIDPPGDGSTTDQLSAVSSTGVRANAFGICPSGTAIGTYCMMNYATGDYYAGRWCQPYLGSARCVLYPN